MVKRTAFPPVQRKMTPFEVKEWRGVDRFAPHSTLKPGEIRTCVNLDLYKNGYMKGRLGSAVLNAIENTLDGYDIVNGVAWDTGTDEYAVLQGIQGTSTYFISLKLERDAAFAVINNYAGTAYSIAGQTDPMALQLSGGRLFAFGTRGNAVIDWTGTAFKARPMGLQAPSITSAAGTGSGSNTGRWTVGIELVYRINGADFLSSGINRYLVSGPMATFSGTSVVGADVLIDSTTIAYPSGIALNDFSDLSDGMFVRLWRSKNQAPISIDPLSLPDTFGLEDELYPITLAPLQRVIDGTYSQTGLTPYEIHINNLQDESILTAQLANITIGTDIQVATTDYFELSPIPAAPCGCQHKGRIWFATSAGKLQYSKITDTPYSEAYAVADFVPCDPGDGQSIVWMQGMDKDLVIFKEGKTGRIMDGDPAMGFNLLDSKVGLSHLKLASYIPSLGIVAINGDQKDVRLFGYDLQWSNIAGDGDIAKRIRAVTKAMATSPTYAGFAWMNGKLFLSPGDGTLWPLHSEEGLGWTQYIYPMGGLCQFILPFANGSRLAAFTSGRFATEIETETDAFGEPIDTDVNVFGEEVQIDHEWTTHRFQSGEGRHMLEFDRVSIMGELSNPLYATAYSNGRLWPSGLESEETQFTPDPAQMTGYAELMDREYTLHLKAPRPCGSFLHFSFRTAGPCSIRSQVLQAYVQSEVRQDFDPFQIFRYKRVGPPWSNQALCVLTFDDDRQEALDYSGWARHHTYDPGLGGSMSLLPGFAPGNGARFQPGTGSGLFPSSWQAMEGMGDDDDGLNSRARAWKVVFRVPELAGGVIAEAGDPDEDSNYWRLRLTASGQIIFEHGIAAAAYTFSTATGLILADTIYALCFVLTNGGANGQFYVSSLAATSFPGARRTTRAALVRQAPPDKHCVAFEAGIDLTWYETLLGDLSERDAKKFWQEMKEAT